MRAIVLQTPGRPLRLAELQDPEPGPGQVLVRVRACGVCRTDLHIVDGELPDPKLPLVPGHQVVAEVVANGPISHRFQPGQRVGIGEIHGQAVLVP
jgi:propanol-preferring alcohol dehydrogenase